MSEIAKAIKQICEEKKLSYDAVIETIESAMSAAYRKDFGQKNQNIHVVFNEEDITKSKVYDIKTVVEDLPEEEMEEEEEDGSEANEEEVKKEEKKDKKGKEEPKKEDPSAGSGQEKKDKSEKEKDEEDSSDGEEEEEAKRFNPKTEIQLSDAKELKKTAKVGDEIKTKLDVPEAYGRMAAQTAKQVIIQRLREAEREMVFNDFKDKEGEVVSGVVQRRENKFVLVDLGKSVGILANDEQIPGEKYAPGDRVKVYVKEVNLKTKGPEIVLSRTSEEILKKVFLVEIPEIANGIIELKNVSREAGSRSKVAVWTDSDSVDPIGSCVGQKGARIQTIINELGGEKVDIVEYDDAPEKYITNALSPAKIIDIEINEEEKKVLVKVATDQLSLAIGKGGQNVRLAARLTGWKIDIAEIDGEVAQEKKEEEKDEDNSSADEDTSTSSVEAKEDEKDESDNKEDLSATSTGSGQASSLQDGGQAGQGDEGVEESEEEAPTDKEEAKKKEEKK